MSQAGLRIAVIDYGAGNLRSVTKALSHVAPEAEVALIDDAGALDDFSHIVLPGVGAFGDCIGALRALPGMVAEMERAALEQKKPFFGICVGMQLLFERGLEHGEHAGLGWFKGQVTRIAPSDASLKVPHMGWNGLDLARPQHPLFMGLPAQPYAYFVHSYHATGVAAEDVLATVEYGATMTAMVGRDNIVATQFHPEKSQEAGLCLLRNFAAMPSTMR